MRTRLIPFFLLLIVLYSCKKDPFVNPDEVRLLKLESKDSLSNRYNTIFDYDQQGRIVKVSYSKNSETPATVYTINYYGNTASVITVPFSGSVMYGVSAVTYTLNADHQPIERIQYDSFSVVPPERPQRTIKKDTARYTYDGNGLLVKVTGSYIDSTWFDPGVVEITTDKRSYIRDYINSEGMLTGISTHIQDLYYYKSAGVEHNSTSTTEVTHSFEYIRHKQNKTDFTNAWLLAELGILYQVEYPLNKNYVHYPDKITYSDITRDQTGQIVTSSNSSFTISLDYNKYGFISSYDTGNGIQNKKSFIYNH